MIAEEKVYSKAAIEEDFADDRVLVVLNAETSKKLADYNEMNFSELRNIKIRDLTAGTKAVLKSQKISGSIQAEKATRNEIASNISIDTFRQILCIELQKQPHPQPLFRTILRHNELKRAIGTHRQLFLHIGIGNRLFFITYCSNEEKYDIIHKYR